MARNNRQRPAVAHVAPEVSVKEVSAAVASTSPDDGYLAPALVDVQALVADPRRTIPQRPDTAQIQAAHQESVDAVLDEYEQSVTRAREVDADVIERSRALSLDEVRAQLPHVEDRAKVITRDGASHESSLDLIRKEMESSTITIVSAR